MQPFIAAFENVPFRAPKNVRHDLVELLVIAFIAVLCGGQNCSEMARVRPFSGVSSSAGTAPRRMVHSRQCCGWTYSVGIGTLVFMIGVIAPFT
jgi:hypothetical protein